MHSHKEKKVSLIYETAEKVQSVPMQFTHVRRGMQNKPIIVQKNIEVY